MKRGERQMWRKLVRAIDALTTSENYAQEYIARRNVERLVKDLKDRNAANVHIFESSLFNKGILRTKV